MKKNVPVIMGCILIILANLTISCTNREINEKESFLKSVVENNLGNRLVIPDNLRTYAAFNDFKMDSAQMFSSKLKIYSHINVSCPTCIGDIRLWNDLIIELEKFKVPVILVCNSNDNFEQFTYMYETGEINNFSYPFFFDEECKFIEQNKFMIESSYFETVLTDSENKILLMGNPIRSKEMKDIYLKEIQKSIELNQEN